MNKKDIKKINDYSYFYEYNDTVTYSIGIIFTYKTNRKNFMIGRILSRYITMINKRFKNPNEYDRIRRGLYNVNIYTSGHTYKDNSTFKIYYRMVDPKRVKDDYYDDAIKFLYDIVCNPYFINNKLDADRIDIIKRDIYNQYLDYEKDLQYQFYSKYDLTVRKDNIFTNVEYYKDSKELKDMLDSITDEDIINFYNELINNHFKTLFFGKMSKKEIDKFNNLFKFNKSKVKEIIYDQELDLKSEYNEYKTNDYSQSILVATYKTNNYKKYAEDDLYAYALSIMSNSKDGMYFDLLRDKYGLAYTGGVSYEYKLGQLRVIAYIDKKNKDKTIDVIKEYFKDLHDVKKVSKKLKFAKEQIKEREYLMSEDTYSMFNRFEMLVLEKTCSDRAFISKVNKLNVNDMIEFIDSLEKENIFFFEGGKDE